MSQTKRWLEQLQAEEDERIQQELESQENYIFPEERVDLYIYLQDGRTKRFRGDVQPNNTKKSTWNFTLEFTNGDLNIFVTPMTPDGYGWDVHPKILVSEFDVKDISKIVHNGKLVALPEEPKNILISIGMDTKSKNLFELTIANREEKKNFGPIKIQFLNIGEAWAWFHNLLGVEIPDSGLQDLSPGEVFTFEKEADTDLSRFPFQEMHDYAVIDADLEGVNYWSQDDTFEYNSLNTKAFRKVKNLFKDDVETETLIDSDGQFIYYENEDDSLPVLFEYTGPEGIYYRIDKMWIHMHPEYSIDKPAARVPSENVEEFVRLIDDKTISIERADQLSLPI